MKFERKIIHPFWIAVLLALLGTIVYVLSGRAGLDQSTRELEGSQHVEKVTSSGKNTLLITCKNGQQYEIVYQEGQTDFQDLVYEKCAQE